MALYRTGFAGSGGIWILIALGAMPASAVREVEVQLPGRGTMRFVWVDRASSNL
jgi:hypothetical protein